MLAADGRHHHTVKILINAGAIVSAGGGGPEGATALHLSSKNNDVIATSILINAGADVSAKSTRCESTPIHLAAERGYGRVIEVLARGGADVDARMIDGATAMFLAAESGRLLAVKALLRFHADPLIKTGSGYVPLDVATEKGYLDIVRELVNTESFGEGETPLRLAAQHGYCAILEALYNAGARDKNGRALCAAVEYGRSSAVEFLLRHPQPRWPIGDKSPGYLYVNGARSSPGGMSPLLCSLNCIGRSTNKVLKLLIDAGAETMFTFNRVDANNKFLHTSTPLETVATIIRERGLGSVKLTEEEVCWTKTMQKILKQADAIRAVSWGWVSICRAGGGAVATPVCMAPMRKEKADRKKRVVTRALLM